MLKSLKTKNFRKLNDATFEFTQGLNVIRAVNEAGKSTLLEAVMYAMFGVKACRTPLAEVATWGARAEEVKVELVICIDSIDYTIKRSAQGAEVNYDGGVVVGQNEVSNFVASKLGVSVQAAPKIMLAGQGEIRGSLAGNDAETVKLIETLANLGIIDKLAEAIKDNLPTGVDTAAKARLLKVCEDLDSLVPVNEDQINAMRGDVVAAMQDIDGLEAELLVTQKQIKELNEEAATISSAKDIHQRHADWISKLEGDLLSVKSRLAQVQVPAEVTAEEVEQAQAALTAAQTYAVHKAISDHGKEANEQFDLSSRKSWANRGELEARLAQLTAERANLLGLLSSAQHQVRQMEAKLITETACGLCGKDLSVVPEVVEKNKATNAKLVELRGAELTSASALEHCNEEIKACEYSYRCGDHLDDLARKYPHFFQPVYQRFPSKLDWVGPELPNEQPNITKLAQTLANKQQSLAEFTSIQATRAQLQQQLKTQTVDLAAYKAAAPPAPDLARVAQLDAEVEKLSQGFSTLKARLAEKREEHGVKQRCLSKLLMQMEHYEKQRDKLLEDKRAASAALFELTFNNLLVKRLRELRPEVGNFLWNKVLESVSNYFSEMRGQPSLVTKEASGFKVDGQSIAGLSGSTLDMLGLAVRLALSKTFAPHVGAIVLDEPFAACDEKRTADALAFVASCGFHQIILVTHEDTSTANADNIISI